MTVKISKRLDMSEIMALKIGDAVTLRRGDERFRLKVHVLGHNTWSPYGEFAEGYRGPLINIRLFAEDSWEVLKEETLELPTQPGAYATEDGGIYVLVAATEDPKGRRWLGIGGTYMWDATMERKLPLRRME